MKEDHLMLKTLVLCQLAVTYLSYYWSVIGLFRKDPSRETKYYRALLIVSSLTWIATVYEIATTAAAAVNLIALFVLLALFCSLFWWAAKYAKAHKLSVAFSKDIPMSLITEGPYKYIRNPFYASYLGTYFSIAILLLAPVTFGFAVTMAVLYYKAAKYEERKFRGSVLAQQFDEYCQVTGMFLPKL